MMPWWIRAEDLATAFIGPFDTREAADAHRASCTDRGDSARMTLTEQPPHPDAFIITPHADMNNRTD